MKNKKIEFCGSCLYLPEEQVFVIGDLHFGYEESLSVRGVAIPRSQFKESMKILKRDMNKVSSPIKKIVILGDIKHTFGKALFQERKEIGDFLDYILNKIPLVELVIVKGNHDRGLDYIIPSEIKRKLSIVNGIKIGETMLIHGDKSSFERIKKEKYNRLIMGHFHPAITLIEGIKKEKYKCFLWGKYKDKELILVPSFFPLVEGMDIITNPDLEASLTTKLIKNFKVIACDEEGNNYPFGKLKKLYKNN